MWLAASSFAVPDGVLATLATAQLNGKPHQGVPAKTLASPPGIGECNSTAAIGLRASLALNRLRQSERARYYGSALGRFTSVDPKMSPHNIRDPQSWNKYVYARNNPLQYVDPDGRDWQTVKNNLVAAFNGTVNAFKLAGEALGHAYTSVGKNLSENPGFSFSSITFEDANNIGKNLTLGAVLGPEGGVLEGAGAAESAAASASTSSDVMFTHFTDGQGLQGITGLDPATLGSGETTTVSTLQFGTGNNSYLAGQSGDIFATNLPANTSSLSLSQIGVFGDKQSFGISFSGTDAASQGVMVQGQGEGIYTLPAGSKLTGCFTVTCRQ